jgi:hypothetical protein
VRKLTPNEKLVYIYLITNSETRPSGIYKIFWDYHAHAIGIPQKTVKTCLASLAHKQKIVLLGDWVFVRAFLDETFKLKTSILSLKIKTAIQKQFTNENVPIGLIACFHAIYNTLSIPYPYPIAQIIDFRLEILDFRLEIGETHSVDPDIKKCPEHGVYKTEQCKTCVRTELFNKRFWNKYPPRDGRRSGKLEALKAFIKLPEKDILLVLRAVSIYQQSRGVKKGIGIMNASGWLNQKRYLEYQISDEPEPKQESPTARRYREALERGDDS